MANNNMASILDSVKQSLGIVPDYEHFDDQLIMFINSVFPVLYELGVGPDDGFEIEDNTALWSDFLGSGKLLNQVKSYMFIKVKLLFDPPASSFAIEAMNKMAQEHEWRIMALIEPTNRASNSGGVG